MAIKDYSTTAASNTTLEGINCAESGMTIPSINNLFRAMAASLRSAFNDFPWFEYGDGDGSATVAYASATSFTVAGADVTGVYHAGRVVRAVGSLTGTIYGAITSSSFSTNTTVNVTWFSGSLSNESITVSVSIIPAANSGVPMGALGRKGADVASSGTISLGDGDFFHITGTTTITDIDFTSDRTGRHAWLVFDGALTLTHNATTLILPTGANITTAAGDACYIVSEDGTDNIRVLTYVRKSGNPLITESLIIACSDETTALTAGTSKVTFRMPYAFTLTAVRASLSTAQTSGSIFTVDINETGVSVLSTKLTIDNTEKTSTTALTAAVISDTALADDAEITVDIDQVGDGTAKGLKVTLLGYRA